jgi:arylsulfatase A-like enzyme
LVKKWWRQAFGPYPPEELYDLKTDPGQISNLAQNPKWAKDLRVMRTKLNKLWKVASTF